MATPGPAATGAGHVVRLAAGTTFIRVHWSVNDPIWFGPAPGAFPGGRFDAPAGQYRTMYGADELVGAFAETVLRKAARIIAWPIVAKRSWSSLAIKRDATLAMLHGDGLVSWGVTADICTGDDYGRSQALALSLHAHGLDGIVYRSRHNNDHICYALFDGMDSTAFEVLDTNGFEDVPVIANGLLRRHGAVWDPLAPLPPLPLLA